MTKWQAAHRQARRIRAAKNKRLAILKWCALAREALNG